MSDRAVLVSKLATSALRSNAVGVTSKGHFELVADALESKELGELVPLHPEVLDAIVWASAQKLIAEKWQALGAADGPLGAPTAPLRFSGAFIQDYGGGYIELRGGNLKAVQQRRVRVYYAGMHCFGEQSGAPGAPPDEIYAFVNAYAPAQVGRVPTAIKIPAGDRTIPMRSKRSSAEGFGEIWSGPPQDLCISAVLWEEDGGFADEKKHLVDAALASGATAAGFAVGGPFGAAAAGAAAAAFVPEFTSFLASELLGSDDDYLDSKAQTVLQQDQMGPLPVQSNYGLQFTHETALLTDGDASYKLFFQVVREDFTATL
jgi:hypothetical protein